MKWDEQRRPQPPTISDDELDGALRTAGAEPNATLARILYPTHGLPGIVTSERPVHARKDRRKWCGGKDGIPHAYPLAARVRHRYTCRYWPWGLRPGWHCSHETYCTVCGKVMEDFLGPERCPDYPPETP